MRSPLLSSQVRYRRGAVTSCYRSDPETLHKRCGSRDRPGNHNQIVTAATAMSTPPFHKWLEEDSTSTSHFILPPPPPPASPPPLPPPPYLGLSPRGRVDGLLRHLAKRRRRSGAGGARWTMRTDQERGEEGDDEEKGRGGNSISGVRERFSRDASTCAVPTASR